MIHSVLNFWDQRTCRCMATVETVQSIFDIMDLTAEENFPGLMIFIDFQKAFDTVEWCYLQRCLESFNFGPEFIRWVMTFYWQSCTKLCEQQWYHFWLFYTWTKSEARGSALSISICCSCRNPGYCSSSKYSDKKNYHWKGCNKTPPISGRYNSSTFRC